MNNIKKFRVAFGYTQKELAKHLGTTQQTLGRWENGDSEPKQIILKDMALLFETTIDDLLNNNPLTAKLTTNRYYLFKKKHEIDGFWGHLGIMFKGQTKHHWFPITEQTAVELYDLLDEPQKYSIHQPFISLHTLNNRVLWINIKKIKGISISNDNASMPSGDWNLTWDGYQGYPAEIYRALADSCYEGLSDYSENFQKQLQEIIVKHNLDEDSIIDKIRNTYIYSVNGIKESIGVNSEYLWDIEWHITGEYKFENNFLKLSSYDIDRFKNMSHITMMSAPLHSIMDEAAKELKETGN